ncbi:MAG TPA: PilZ domain-containing protein [Caulobacterales bacterium]|nr:PilZ domain-containing protein [Caulobacterales bacterium]
MFSLKFKLHDKASERAPDADVVEHRAQERQAVFREAQLVLDDFYKIRAVMTELSETGARVRYANRVDLPSRIRISEPTFKIHCWARVVWQKDGSAGLEFLRD